MVERRSDYPQILGALESIKVEMAKLATKVEERNIQACEWRDNVCKKFETVFGKIDGINVYCQSKQAGRFKMWVGITMAFVVPMLTFAVVWGKTVQQVDGHRDRLVKMESQIERLQLK